jgi:nucleoside-diphosphate-sugar epimerase
MAEGKMKRILVTGAVGQIGSELTVELRRRYGAESIDATGHRTKPSAVLCEGGLFEFIDVSQRETLDAVVEKHNIDTIYHMAAILSAVGEEKPHLAWNVNMNGLYNVLEVARERGLTRVFCPSSIAAFGPETPRDSTPQETVLRPTTMYGVTKVAGELLCNYYVRRFGVDVRGAVSRHYQQRDPAGRRNHRLCRGHLLRGHRPQTLHLLCTGGYRPADDVHARLYQGDDRSDGGGLWSAEASRRL